MSRKRGEFQFRTSIFEGAYRAWSHLGGIDPMELEGESEAKLNPRSYQIQNDERLEKMPRGKAPATNIDGTLRRWYPYEPLPKGGLGHGIVQIILQEWLGESKSDAELEQGYVTVRNWWQHRKKGESGQAIKSIGTGVMEDMVERYRDQYFTLFHCTIFHDGEEPPRTLALRQKELAKARRAAKIQLKKEERRLLQQQEEHREQQVAEEAQQDL